jgi:hypothetical protein
VGVHHTDNINLATENPQRDTVYELLPSFTLAQEAKRVRTDLDYSVNAYHYHELDEDNVYQLFDGAFVAALDPDNFFLEIGATRNQTIRDPEGSIPWGNLPISSNLTDRDDYYAGPSFQYGFGRNGTVQASFRRDHVRYDEEGDLLFASEFDTDYSQFSVDNYRKARGFTWAVTYNADTTDFGLPQHWEYRQAGIEIGGWATRRFRLFAAAGKESPWDDPFDPSLEDEYWEVGFATDGSRNVSLEVAAGDRTFGSTSRADLDVVFPRGQTALQYSEQPTTLDYRNWDVSSLTDLLTRVGSSERYISKLFSWSLSFDISRTVVSVFVYDESREQRMSIDGTALPDEDQSGADLTARWRIGAKTDVLFSVRGGRWETFDTGERRLHSFSIGADYRLGRRTALSLLLSRNEEDTDTPGLGYDYRADVITLLLNRTF